MISLIIPTLNESEVLRKTLAGLTDDLKKKWQVEVIVSDGGSKDNTVRIARELGAIIVEPRAGDKQTIAGGRNDGAAVARGEVLIFLDADTYPKDWGKLLEAADKLKQDDRMVAATVSVEIEPKERKFKDIIWQNLFNLVFFTENAIGLAMGRGNCQIVKAAAFKAVGAYNENLAAAEDYDLYRRLGKTGKIKILWHIIVYESPRRFRRYGYMKVAWWWSLNGINVLLRKKAWSKKWGRVN